MPGYEAIFGHYFSLHSREQNVAVVGSQVAACYYPHKRFGRDYWQMGPQKREGQQNLLNFNAWNPLTVCLLIGDEAKNAQQWLEMVPPIFRNDEKHSNGVKLQSGDLSIDFCQTESGIRLYSVMDQKNGFRWLKNGDGPFFTALIKNLVNNEDIWISSSSGWGRTQLQKTKDGVRMSFNENIFAPGISINLQAKVVPTANRIEWECDLDSISDTLSIIEWDYPRLCFDAPDNLNILTPYLSGQLCSNCGKSSLYMNQRYCTPWCSMPLFSIWNPESRRGLYYAVHDPEGNTKRVNLDKHFTGFGSLSIAFMAENALHPNNSQKMKGKNVWQLYDGDWYDAAILYRNWTESEANWLPVMNEEHVRTDSPAWIHDIGLWTLVFVNDEDEDSWVLPVIELQKKLDVPMAVHLYLWYEVPSDTCNPHYFPVRKTVFSGIQHLQDAGIRVIPYINGRVWDINDGEDYKILTGLDPEYTFIENGADVAVLKENGQILLETYVSRRPVNGERVQLAVGCLSQQAWRDIICNVSERIYDEIKTDGIYIDQGACDSFISCYSAEHGHPLGPGGKWHIESMQEMMRQVRTISKRKGIDAVYLAEDHAEPFVDTFDGLLTWHWSGGGLVPLFSTVYSDKVTLFGRDFAVAPHLSEEDRKNARITFAEQMTFGDQLGWRLDFLMNKGASKRDFEMYRQAIQLRYAYREYYSHGTLCRPPVVICDASDIVVHHPAHFNTTCLYGHPVAASLRRHASGKKKLLTLMNITNQPLLCEIQCEIADGSVHLDGALKETVAVSGGRLSLMIPAYSTVMGVSEDNRE